jgi:hypothetical protein
MYFLRARDGHIPVSSTTHLDVREAAEVPGTSFLTTTANSSRHYRLSSVPFSSCRLGQLDTYPTRSWEAFNTDYFIPGYDTWTLTDNPKEDERANLYDHFPMLPRGACAVLTKIQSYPNKDLMFAYVGPRS